MSTQGAAGPGTRTCPLQCGAHGTPTGVPRQEQKGLENLLPGAALTLPGCVSQARKGIDAGTVTEKD